jgi:hypothetical protein
MTDSKPEKITFKGPGQWRSQADDAQKDTRPPARVLDGEGGKQPPPKE